MDPDLVQMLAEATTKTDAECPFKDVPEGAKKIGPAPPHLKGVFDLFAQLAEQKKRGDARAVSGVLSRALGQHFSAALEARREEGGPPWTGFVCGPDWQVYIVEPNVVTIAVIAA